MSYNDQDYCRGLERRLSDIDIILGLLLFSKNRGDTFESMSGLFKQIEDWLGDDWWLSLPEEKQAEYIFRNTSLD